MKPDFGTIEKVESADATEFKGDPSKASWLPNEALAKARKAKMGY